MTNDAMTNDAMPNLPAGAIVELVEALPENRSGSDKGSRWRGNPRYCDLTRRGRFVRRS